MSIEQKIVESTNVDDSTSAAIVDTHGGNIVSRRKWQGNHYTNDIEVIGDIFNNPELIAYPTREQVIEIMLGCDEPIEDTADKILELLSAQTNWISVEDRLPENFHLNMSRDVLTIAGKYKMKVSSYDYELKRWNGYNHVSPTHWQPLPTPPKH